MIRVAVLDQRIISQEPIANTDVWEELKQLLTACDLDTMEKYFFADQNGLLTGQEGLGATTRSQHKLRHLCGKKLFYFAD